MKKLHFPSFKKNSIKEAARPELAWKLACATFFFLLVLFYILYRVIVFSFTYADIYSNGDSQSPHVFESKTLHDTVTLYEAKQAGIETLLQSATGTPALVDPSL